MGCVDFCSFRDPSGVVLKYNNRILRFLRKNQNADFQTIFENPLVQELIQEGKLVPYRFLSESEFNSIAKEIPSVSYLKISEFDSCVEHKKVFFPSYPYEWASEMLHSAGRLTIDLAKKLLRQNLGIKDASPYNVLFTGPNPIFVDHLSFEVRNKQDPVWLPYAQFMRTFTLPLMANQKCHVPLNQIFLSKSDGINPEELYKMTSLCQRVSPSFLFSMTLPSLFSSSSKVEKEKIYEEKRISNPEKAKFVLDYLFNGLQKNLKKLAPKTHQSKWTSYFSKKESYSNQDFDAKVEIVSEYLDASQPKAVLDVGCNTGFYSILAAKKGATVVSIDSDSAVIGKLWREAKESQYDILPLVVDICRPSPPLGWRNQENLSFLQRAEGTFDTVMMLAVIHHMLITDRIPLEDIAQLCAKLTTKNLIIEFIAKEDQMFQRLLRGRNALYEHLTKEYFEQVFQTHFQIQSCKRVGQSSRWMYHLQKRA